MTNFFRQAWDTYTDKWDAINLTFVPFTQEELDEREEITAEVTDPDYLLRRQDADADGEVDEEEVNVEAEVEPPNRPVHGVVIAEEE